MSALAETLYQQGDLPDAQLKTLLSGAEDDALRQFAVLRQQQHFGRTVYIRGLLEISNICKNNCYYCGIRAGNGKAVRYRLTDQEILSCCAYGYALGFRTFVLQGGEDPALTDEAVCCLIQAIKARHPDCAVTLSLGEKSRTSYARLRAAGADRYLLRHETADRAHYNSLHPPVMSFDDRLRCLRDLKALGYQTGCGFMVGSPGQTTDTLVKDLRYIKQTQPEMVGIGPFIPHAQTPFAACPPGELAMTLRLLSIVRLLLPRVLLPATTALGTLVPGGREQGILAGANVVMPNLSPAMARAHYTLYDNKLNTGAESAEGLHALRDSMARIGYEIVIDRGDAPRAVT